MRTNEHGDRVRDIDPGNRICSGCGLLDDCACPDDPEGDVKGWEQKYEKAGSHPDELGRCGVDQERSTNKPAQILSVADQKLADCSHTATLTNLTAVPVLAEPFALGRCDLQVYGEPPNCGEARESTKSPKKGEILGSMPISRGGSQTTLGARTGENPIGATHAASQQHGIAPATFIDWEAVERL